MGILSRLDQITGRDAAPLTPGVPAGAGTPALAPTDGSFSQGLRSGMTAAGGQLHALAGGVGEALGAQDFAREQYAKSAAAEQLAAQQAPEVNDWRQVTGAPDLSTGLRRAGQYVAGLAGQSAPAIGLGLGAGALTAATGGGALPMFAAGTAAVAPLEVGGALQRQQADPRALANNSAGMRLGTAALEGVGRAAAMNAVPQLMGGKVLGKVAGSTESLPAAVATNVAEGVGGNAAAGAAAQKISDVAASSLNPNRDTSGDDAAMLDAAVSGGALGLPFAAAGVAGHALHGKAAAPDAAAAAPDAAAAAKPGLAERIKGVFAKPDEPAAEKVARGEDVIDVDALRAAPPEQQVQMVQAADEQRAADAKTWFEELTQDGKLSPENKEKLAAAAQDFTDRANQTVIAGIKVAKDAGEKALNMATAFYDAVSKKGDQPADEGMPLKSDMSAGTQRAIGDVVKPLLAEKFPQLVENETAMRAVTGGLKNVMEQMQETGKLDKDAAQHLQNWFGNDTPAVMAQLHDAVLGSDKAASERYFGALNDLSDRMGTTSKLADKVRAALPPEMKADATPEQVNQLISHLREYVSGATMADKPEARRVFESRQIEDGLRAHFGDKTDSVLKAVKADLDAQREAADARLEDDRLSGNLPADHVEYAPEDEQGLAAHPDAGLSEQDTARRYYGGGNDADNPTFILSEAAHRRIYGNEASQAARVKAKASAENPDMNVMAIPAREYARENGIPNAQLHDMTNGNPDDHVMIKAEGVKRDGITWNDVDKLRLDTHRYPDSKSRIDTEDGVILDAKRVLNMYAPEHMLPRDAQDAANPFYRLRRQFSEAIGTLSDHMGENIDVPDHTVVAKRGGRDITWGELQKLGRVKDAGPVDALYSAREEAAKAGDTDKVAALDRKISSQIMRANDPADELPDGLPRKVAVNNEHGDMQLREQLASTAKDMGGVRKTIERLIARNGPLRGEDGKLRKLDSVERDALDQHAALTEQYNKLAGKLGEKRFDEGALEHAQSKDGNKSAWLTKGDDGTLEADPFGNVHAAVRGIGEDKLGGAFAGARNMEAGPEGNMLHAANFEERNNLDGSMSTVTRNALDSKINRLENWKSAAARAVGAKARELFAKVDHMKMVDQGELASIIKDDKVSSIAQTVNALHAKYKNVEPTAKKPSAFVDRVVGKGDVAPVVRAIKASTDPVEVRRAVDALIPHQRDASARAVLAAANERIAHLLQKDPDAAYSMQKTDPGATHTSGVRADVKDYIDRVLGKQVETDFAPLLHAGEFEKGAGAKLPDGTYRDVIRVSIHALDPMGTAYHESLHAFFSKLREGGLMADAHPLMRAADSTRVRDQLRVLLKDEPAAWRQAETNLEERAAYMYQFWAAGKLHLPARPSGILGHIADFFKRVMGIWTNDARALHIMDYFHSGEYARNMGDRGAVARALAEGSNERVEQFKEFARPLTKLADAVVSTGDARLRGSFVPALTELADKVYAPMQGDSADPGYVPASRAKRSEVMNDLARRLADYSPAQITDALTAMQKRLPADTPEGRIIVREVRKTLDHMHDYMTEAGVQLGDMGYGKDYFPRVWDPRKIVANEAEFRAMLQQYKDAGKFGGSIDQVMAALTRADGSELQVETVKPGFQSSKQRVLSFIRGEDAEPFLNKNLYETINNYVTQATRRAEWARRFDDDGKQLAKLMERAEKEGASKEDLQFASDYLQGVDGTLGDKINPKLRRAFGDMVVYQNVRLLPLAIFSSLIDPMGVLVRGGTVGEAFKTMKRGFAEIPKGFKKGAKDDEWTKLAADMGVIDSAVLMHALGSTTYTQGMTGNFARRVNDTFFKFNLMEQFNTSMRVGATEAAVGFLGRHADGTASQHSARWLAELGYKPGEIVVKNSRPLLTAAEFKAHGLSDDAAQAAADKMTMAVNKWVDGAILRPNAAHKPVWMNDPHYALLAHLKQFVYAFQETILKRVANEARFGNVGPAYSLAAYVPFMLAADTMKGMIQGGGQQPDWKKGWDAGDYAFYELQRAGLFGVGQFGIDAAKDLHRGGMGIGALAGPTVEQLGEAVQTVAGPEQFKTFALHSMPANALVDAGESAITNAVD